jgi:signal transduction histidine kinase
VSEQHTRDDLESALAAAKEALRLCREFLRLVGHELRSPLTAVQLQVDSLAMLAHQGGSAEALEVRADRVRRSVHRMAWMVEDVVDLARAIGGPIDLHTGEADLVVLARRALDRFAGELRRSGCEARVSSAGPVTGTWDATRIERAIGALLLVATKSGGGQPIALEVADGGDGDARVSVRDAGAGLPPAETALAFEPFDRLLSSVPPGSPALGLWLVRVVVEGHGGRLVLAPGLGELHLPKTGPGGQGLIGGAGGQP